MRYSRAQLLENRARRAQRDRLHRRHGYDSRRAIRLVLSLARPLAGRVLEIGTGKGRFLVELARLAQRVVTVDKDAAEQGFARLNAADAGVSRGIRFVIADGADLPFPARSFDAVVSMNALHHIRDHRSVIGEMLRVLKPGGKIVLADFDAKGFRIFDRVHASEGRIHERRPYRWDGIAARLRRAGWRIRRARGENTEVLLGEGRATRDVSRLRAPWRPDGTCRTRSPSGRSCAGSPSARRPA